MAVLKQSTGYTRMFLMVQSADHITGLSSATTPTVTLSKAGGAFGAAAGTVTAVSSGWSSIVLTTVDTNTLGDLAFHCTASGADPMDFVDQVCANILGDTLPANTTQLAGQTVTAAAGVTFPSSVASPSNITAGTITSVSSNVAGSVTSVSSNVVGSVGSVTASVTVGTNSDKTGYTLTATAQSSLADVILDRDMSLGVDNGSTSVRTPRQALRFLRNKWAISAGTLTVYKEDDAASSWTATVGTDASAVPIVSNDPAGP